MTRILDFKDHVGGEVNVRGWLHNKRSSGKLQFLILRDGSGFAQAVMAKAAVPPEAWEAADKAGQESTLEVTGKVREDKRAPGGYEMDVRACAFCRPSTTTRSRPRTTVPPSSSSTGTCGCARPGSTR